MADLLAQAIDALRTLKAASGHGFSGWHHTYEPAIAKIEAVLTAADGFSDFIRNATPIEKEKVYGEVMDKVIEQQRAVIAADGVRGTYNDQQKGSA